LLVICPQPGTSADLKVAFFICFRRSESAIYTESRIMTFGMVILTIVSRPAFCDRKAENGMPSSIMGKIIPMLFCPILLNLNPNNVENFVELLEGIIINAYAAGTIFGVFKYDAGTKMRG
jgi:hypothetical protein